MGWQDDHRERVDGFPAEIKDAHQRSIHHRADVESSTLCGCFYCLAQFAPSAIVEWVDEDDDGRGSTATCPRCGIDSVLGDRSGFPISPEFLAEMQRYWFRE